MHTGELRRLLIVALPALTALTVVAVLVGTVLRVDGNGGPSIASSTPAVTRPRIGQDHWHATYEVFICGQRQPNFPSWEASEGVHTHADGIIHMHPFIPAGEGAGARLIKWFEYGGGKLTQSEMQMPGDREEYKNGQTCDDGSEAVLQVFVNGEKLRDWSEYIPQDGDRVRIVFGEAEAD